MKVIGLTGCMGSGKTYVSGVYSHLEIPVFNSDDESKRILTHNENVVKKITNTFGHLILNENEIPDRKKLAALVFKDTKKLELLNSILHPAVGEAFRDWANKQNSKYVIKESALLVETGLYQNSFSNIIVTCPLEKRIERAIGRDKSTREEVLNRMNKQMSEEQKKEKCEFEIINDGEHLLLPQIIELHQKFSK